MELLEDIQLRHRKELKDLQAKITQKKKNATKKSRKGINAECEELERQLKERQEQERATLNHNATHDVTKKPSHDEIPVETSNEPQSSSLGVLGVAATPTSTTPLAADEKQLSPSASPSAAEPLKPSTRAGHAKTRNRHRERLARRAAEEVAAVAAARDEAANLPDQRELERQKIALQATAYGLTEHAIRPDGHCLFSAVADQLCHVGIALGQADSYGTDQDENQRYKIIRKAAAAYMQAHPDEFVAWLDEPLAHYVEKIRDTAEWGGHLELLALAKTYNVTICVLQEGATHCVGPAVAGRTAPVKIWLAYYRHGFGLGEHYNSLRGNH